MKSQTGGAGVVSGSFPPIDFQILDRVRSLRADTGTDELHNSIAEVSRLLPEISLSISQNDMIGLEQAARDLFLQALITGAPSMLHLAYEIRICAACADREDAARVARELSRQWVRTLSALHQRTP